MNWLRKFLSSYLLHKCYDSLDTLPIWHWNEIHRTGNYKHLIITRKYLHHNYTKLWLKLNDEYFERFGIPEGYKLFLKNLKACTIAMGEYAVSRDPIAYIDMKRLNSEIDAYLSKTEKSDFMEELAAIQKLMGIKIDPKITSVAEYKGMINFCEKLTKKPKQK